MQSSLQNTLDTLNALKHKCFILIKPPAFARGMTDTILEEFKRRGFQIILKRTLKPTRVQAEEHYQEHSHEPFYEKIVDRLCSGEVCIAVVLSAAENNVELCRSLVGATDPKVAEAGTIRARFGSSIDDNIIHCSDSNESADRETRLWYRKD